MNNPIILERDTPIYDWTAYDLLSTSQNVASATTWFTHSDGILHDQFATFQSNYAVGSTTADNVRSGGVNMKGPEPGDEYTPYRIDAVAVCDDVNVRPVLFIGESIAAITDDAAGDVITDIRQVAQANAYGPEGASLHYNGIILAKENTAGRGLMVGIGMLAGAAGAAACTIWTHLSVRRLIGVNPTVLNTRKQ